MNTIPAHPRDAFVKSIFSSIAPEIDIMSSLFCFGLDLVWRRKLVAIAKIKKGEKILDVCTGTGKLALLLAQKADKGAVTGADFCEEMMEVAKKKPGASDVSFMVSNAKALVFDNGAFDVVTVAFGMRNIFDTSMALHEAYRVLKPGGRFYCLELTCPQKKWLMPFYNFYCFNIMPTVAKLILKTDTPYSYLPRSIQAFPLAEEFRHIIEGCGFSNVTVNRLSCGIATIFEARKLPGKV